MAARKARGPEASPDGGAVISPANRFKAFPSSGSRPKHDLAEPAAGPDSALGCPTEVGVQVQDGGESIPEWAEAWIDLGGEG